jgi:hypothetical protein
MTCSNQGRGLSTRVLLFFIAFLYQVTQIPIFVRRATVAGMQRAFKFVLSEFVVISKQGRMAVHEKLPLSNLELAAPQVF